MSDEHEAHDGRSEPGARGHVRRDAPDAVTPADLLRQALVDDDDPRFPRWLPLPGIALALGWAGFTAATAGADFLHAVLWPGAPIFALTTIATWLGWQLELE
ncbi:MAG: hypothetical protein WC273_05205 [Dehalococcoidia bacterium]